MTLDGIVMPALVAGIHVFNPRQSKDVDGRNKSGHHEGVVLSKHIMLYKLEGAIALIFPKFLAPNFSQDVLQFTRAVPRPRYEEAGSCQLVSGAFASGLVRANVIITP